MDSASYLKLYKADYVSVDVDHAFFKVLSSMCVGDSYVTNSKRTVYVNDWNVNNDYVYHRHKEFTGVKDQLGVPGYLEWDTKDRACTLCGAQIPDAVWLLNKFYSF